MIDNVVLKPIKWLSYTVPAAPACSPMKHPDETPLAWLKRVAEQGGQIPQFGSNMALAVHYNAQFVVLYRDHSNGTLPKSAWACVYTVEEADSNEVDTLLRVRHNNDIEVSCPFHFHDKTSWSVQFRTMWTNNFLKELDVDWRVRWQSSSETCSLWHKDTKPVIEQDFPCCVGSTLDSTLTLHPILESEVQ